MPELSIVIPAYNEEKRLLPVLNSVHSFFSAKRTDFEIIVVNDGSVDNTSLLVNQFSNTHNNVRLIEYTPNKGKGFAIKKGVLTASGDLILIDDADGSSPIAESDRLLRSIKNGADLAIGSRAKLDSSCIINALPYRTYIGNTFNRLVQSLLVPGVQDTQCGFKLFKKAVAYDLFSAATINGYAFDVEILYLSTLRKYKLDEVPINWNNVPGSKVNIFVDSLKMLFEVLKIKCNGMQGKYSQNKAAEINEYSSSTK
jgi:dolichyl-phosphate beta-glucosyltransferase